MYFQKLRFDRYEYIFILKFLQKFVLSNYSITLYNLIFFQLVRDITAKLVLT